MPALGPGLGHDSSRTEGIQTGSGLLPNISRDKKNTQDGNCKLEVDMKQKSKLMDMVGDPKNDWGTQHLY